MRVNASELSTLPVYRSLTDTHYFKCRCNPVFSFPTLDDVKLQLNFGQTDPVLITDIGIGQVSTIDSGESIFALSTGVGDIVFEDVNNDGVNEYFINIHSFTVLPVSEGCSYYAAFTINSVRYYTEVFHVCSDVRYKVEYWNDENTQDFGYFSAGYKKTLFLRDIETNTSSYEETTEDIDDGFNNSKPVYTKVGTKWNVDIIGANTIHQSLSYVKHFDNIVLTDLTTSEVYTIKETNGIQGTLEVLKAGSGCVYGLGISWVKHIAEVVKSAKLSSYENGPFDDCDPLTSPPLDCGSFGITISESGGDLTYVVNDNPNPTATLIIQWFVKNDYVGSGSTLTLGAYGTYKVKAIVEDCVTEDEYIYSDPCTMSLDLTNNGAFIYGTINNAPGTPTVSVKDSGGTEVATALPYEAVATDTYTVIITDGVCQVTKNIYVDIAASNSCDFDFVISKNTATKELSITSNTCGGSHVTTWYEITSGDTRTEVATAVDTYTPTQNGAFIAKVVCDGECPVEHLHVIQDFVDVSAAAWNVPFENFPAHTGSVLITKFDLPNPYIWTEEEVNARIDVYVEGVLYEYADTPAEVDQYNFTLATNQIDFFFSPTTKDVQVRRKYL